MTITPEQIAAVRARLLAILAIDKPHFKPGSRNRQWQDRRERAQDDLRKIERGEWRPMNEADLPW